jgi:hypothetical protein
MGQSTSNSTSVHVKKRDDASGPNMHHSAPEARLIPLVPRGCRQPAVQQDLRKKSNRRDVIKWRPVRGATSLVS